MQLSGELQLSLQAQKKTKFTKVKLPVSKQEVSFCEHCHACYKQNKRCDWCSQVYFSDADDGDVDGKTWMMCDGCEKWNHPHCELKYGNDPEQKEAAQKLLLIEAEEEKYAMLDDPDKAAADADAARKLEPQTSKVTEADDIKYYCVKCRKERKQNNQSASKKGKGSSAKQPPPAVSSSKKPPSK